MLDRELERLTTEYIRAVEAYSVMAIKLADAATKVSRKQFSIIKKETEEAHQQSTAAGDALKAYRASQPAK